MLDFILDLVIDPILGALEFSHISRNEGMDRVREVLDERVSEGTLDAGMFVCLLLSSILWNAGAKLPGVIFGVLGAGFLIWKFARLFRTPEDE